MFRRLVRLLVTLAATLLAAYVSRHWLYASAYAFVGSVMVATWFIISQAWPERRSWWRASRG